MYSVCYIEYTKSRPCEILPSVCLDFFSVTTQRNFLTFYMNLGCHTWRNHIFWNKSRYRDFRPKIRFFKFYKKLTGAFFLIFCIKLQPHKALKSIYISLGTISCFEIFWPKGTKTDPKWDFSSLMKSWCSERFLFIESYSSIRA